MTDKNEIFKDLFVLEVANNHWGDVKRGLKIVESYASLIRKKSIKAAFKLQIRDPKTFIHPDFRGNQEIRYIKKTESTYLSMTDYQTLVKAIRNASAIPMATPFDEISVETCLKLEIQLLKIASSDINDWPLIEAIATTKLPVIVSTGGASEENIDAVVSFFEKENIPLAINHCVSLYPTEDSDLELNQIDYLRKRYPGHVIGFSSHEYHDWSTSMFISYAKGVRTWERHIDIKTDDHQVSKYCSLPEKIDVWFDAYNTAKKMCGDSNDKRRICSTEEIEYLSALVRGIYAKRDLEAGYIINKETFNDDFYFAIPLQKGQIPCTKILTNEKLVKSIKKDAPITIEHLA